MERLLKLRSSDRIASLKYLNRLETFKQGSKFGEALLHTENLRLWSLSNYPHGGEACLVGLMSTHPNPSPSNTLPRQQEEKTQKKAKLGLDSRIVHIQHDLAWPAPPFHNRQENKVHEPKRKRRDAHLIYATDLPLIQIKTTRKSWLELLCSKIGHQWHCPRLISASSLTWGNDLPERLLYSVACSPTENSF